MTDDELQTIWKSYDKRLGQALALNRSNAVELTRMKVASRLSSLAPGKWFAVACGWVWCLLLSLLFIGSLLHTPSNLPFVIFTFALFLINAIGVGMYVYHLMLIRRVSNSESVVQVQSELLRLRASTLSVARVMLLQLPFFAAMHMFFAYDPGAVYWIVNGLIVAVFAAVTLWLCLNIRLENRDKQWFRAIFGDREWDVVLDSIDELDRIDENE